MMPARISRNVTIGAEVFPLVVETVHDGATATTAIHRQRFAHRQGGVRFSRAGSLAELGHLASGMTEKCAASGVRLDGLKCLAGDRFIAGGHHVHLEALAQKNGADHPADGMVVVDDENRSGHDGTSMSTMKRGRHTSGKKDRTQEGKIRRASDVTGSCPDRSALIQAVATGARKDAVRLRL